MFKNIFTCLQPKRKGWISVFLFLNSLASVAQEKVIPSSWEVLPIPRYVDYGSIKSFIAIKNVAIVRQEGGPYQTVRNSKTGELVGNSTITEEELTGILKQTGVNVSSVSDRLGSYDGFDALILLGKTIYANQNIVMISIT